MTPDGRILGVIAAGQTASGGPAAPQIQVVLNWFEELKARVPTRCHQLAKRHENPCGFDRMTAGVSGEIDRTSGALEAGELADPERAYLSE